MLFVGVVSCSLFLARCLLIVGVCCLLFVVFGNWLPFVVCCSLFAVCCLLRVACCSLVAVR